jgi:dTDP-4-dehydrorhamnose reductase
MVVHKMTFDKMTVDKILVIGTSGQVGRSICIQLGTRPNVIYADRSSSDPRVKSCNLADTQAVYELILSERPKIIINCAAYTAVDLAEKEFDVAMKINGLAVEALAKAAHEISAVLIHYSTDYVFDGSGCLPWKEADKTSPVNAYGRTKLFGDEAVIKHCPKFGYVFRTQWVYDNEGKNFLNTMLRFGAEREDMSVVGDQIGAPTTSLVIADYTLKALSKILAGNMPAGIYNLVCRGEVSWHGFAEAIFKNARERGLPLKIVNLKKIESKDFPTPAARPKNSRLNVDKLERVLGENLPTWDGALLHLMSLRKN